MNSPEKTYSWWRRLPLHSKLQVGIVGFSLLFLVVSMSFLSLAAHSYFHEKVQRDLLMLADVLADNSRAALLFDDKQSATKILAALKGNPSINAATIITDSGNFAVYPEASRGDIFSSMTPESGAFLQGDHYITMAPIAMSDKKLGWLVLSSDLRELAAFKQRLALFFIGLLLALLIFTFIIYYWLKMHFTKPLVSLSEWATVVSKTKNFETLAEKDSEDEIGQLVDSLNTMLTELSKQASIVSLNERLKNEIEERRRAERDLIIMRNRAESANIAKSRFLANMSHEIRTPMNAIMGFVDMVLDDELSESSRKYLMTVKRSANRLHDLLNDILDLSKLEEGKLQLEEISFSISQLVSDVLKTFEMKAREKQLQLSASLSPVVQGNFIGDPLRLSQILINLVGNAVKFTEQGQVFLDIDRYDGQSLIFKISDTGIGIPADKQEQIFQNFSQEDSSISRKYGGSGLGTTIAKQLVELMGGRIWLESQKEYGTTFFFTVQLKSTERPAYSADSGPSSALFELSEQPLCILIAEDVEENAELLRIRLQAKGHCIDVARNGNEAIALFKAKRYDLILMDVQMPEKDGLSATREIRALEGGEVIPILALTASVLKQDRMDCLQAGMDGFVSKPIVFAELFAEMTRLVQGRSRPPSDASMPKPSRSLQQAGIDLDKGRALWGDERSYIRSLKMFMRKRFNSGADIAEALQHHDRGKAEEILHALKGATGNLALNELYELLVKTSDALKSEQLDLAPLLAQELDRKIKDVAVFVETLPD